MCYAEIAVNSPAAGRRTFSYSVPPHMPDIKVGHAVWVPFGLRVLQGVVIEITPQPAVEETRDIIALIDPRPVLSPARVQLAIWISQYYLAPLFDAVALMLPPGFARRLITYLQPVLSSDEDIVSTLDRRQRMVLDLVSRKGKVDIRAVERAVGGRGVGSAVEQLVGLGLVARTHELGRGKIRPKTVPCLRLTDLARAEASPPVDARRAPRQAALLALLADGPRTVADVRQHMGNATSAVAALKRKGLVLVERVQVYRDPLAHRTYPLVSPPALTPAQQAAWGQIRSALERGQLSPPPGGELDVFLLHGVTGSGKTEIYLRALEQAIALGRRAIVLVPEIALTPQTIQRFSERFPGRVAVLHSKLSAGEQFDEWRRIREGAFDVVIGSRSAVFAPQPQLGLIVIDEEHEWTYKQQEQAPRYHVRDVALRLARLSGALVILGSATPDVVTYNRSQAGEYRLLELPQRIATGERRIDIVDMRQELRAGNRSIFSRALFDGMGQALAAGEQVILFLNRRGSATFVQCRDCGYVPRCRRCDVSLTYHSAREGLVCHQCGYRVALPRLCPQCGSKRIRFLGIGTQRVQEEMARAFPAARLLRWDRDVTGGKHSHEQILDRFVSHEADVLIGTQMIAKGLDLPLVTLVGVINADISLHLPDFRAGERTFQILSQVAGRAGRGALAGQVIVQSYNPEHYAIRCVQQHEYSHFYQQEISLRRQLRNPPFSRLVRMLYLHTSDDYCQRECRRMQRLLKRERDSQGLDIDIIGPSPAFIPRLRGRYRWQLILRGDDPSLLLKDIAPPRGWAVDIDPLSLL